MIIYIYNIYHVYVDIYNHIFTVLSYMYVVYIHNVYDREKDTKHGH